MIINRTSLPGVMLIQNFVSNDKRGTFVKTFHEKVFKEKGLSTNFKESYYSTSFKNVIRGMHFQTPPHAHDKLVYVTNGEILDVIVDLRKDSPTFRQHIAIPLKAHESSIYIPAGCAHGFLTISDLATVMYNVTTVYAPDADGGIKWDTIGFDWPVENPIVSERDNQFLPLQEFEGAF